MNRQVVLQFFRDFAQGSVAEWSKALVLGTSHFGGVGSNPTTIKRVFGEFGRNMTQKTRHHDHKRYFLKSTVRMAEWSKALRSGRSLLM